MTRQGLRNRGGIPDFSSNHAQSCVGDRERGRVTNLGADIMATRKGLAHDLTSRLSRSSKYENVHDLSALPLN